MISKADSEMRSEADFAWRLMKSVKRNVKWTLIQRYLDTENIIYIVYKKATAFSDSPIVIINLRLPFSLLQILLAI